MSGTGSTSGAGDLARVADLVARAGDLATLAGMAATSDPAKAEKGALAAGEAADRALAILANLGASPSVPDKTAGGRPVRKTDPTDLGSLRRLDTPAARELLAALETAAEKARAVDRERGDLDDAGEPDGWAGWLAEAVVKLRLEVEGHPGAGRE